MKALLLINEKSGAVLDRGADAIIDAAQTECARINDLDLEIVSGDFKVLCDAVRKTKDIEAVFSVLLNTDIALLPLPCGTMNLLCRDLGLPLDAGQAIAMGLAAPVKSIDAGCIGERLFLNNIVFGAYAALADAREDIREVESFEDISFGVMEAAHALMNANPIKFSVSIDDSKINQTTNTIVVSNNAVSGAETLIPYRDNLDSGQLFVYLSDASNGAEFAALLADFIRGEIEASERIFVEECRTCSISSNADSFSYTVDGDPVETNEPVEMKIAAGALKVFYPATL
jgi:diacylglycerol kinase family enzyme